MTPERTGRSWFIKIVFAAVLVAGAALWEWSHGWT